MPDATLASHPVAAQALAPNFTSFIGCATGTVDVTGEPPPTVTKLVHNAITRTSTLTSLYASPPGELSTLVSRKNLDVSPRFVRLAVRVARLDNSSGRVLTV